MAIATADPEVTEERIEIPPTVDIKGMSSKFSDAIKKGAVPTAAERAATEKPAEKPVETPVEKPPEKPASKVPEVPVKAEAKPETKPAVDDKKKIPADNFKALETQRDEFKAKHEAAEAKAKELEAKLAQAVDPAKIAELQKKLDETNSKATQYEEIVQRFYVEHSPQFKKAFTDKIATAQAEAKEAVGTEHGAKLEAVLRMPPGTERDKAVEEIGNELSPFQQSDLVTAYRTVKRTEKARDEELGKASENFKNLESHQAEQNRKQQEAHTANLTNAFKDEASVFMHRFPEFQLIEGNTEHNAVVQKNIELAKGFLDPQLAPGERARLALYAAKGYHAIQSDAVKDALIAKLTAQLKGLQAGNPTLGGEGKPADQNAKPMTAAEKYAKAMREGAVPKKGE